MKRFLIAWALGLLLSINGCASMYLGKTEATFETPNGLKGSYISNKNQENFSAKATTGPDGKINGVDIKTTATTPEAAMMAALESMRLFMDAMREQLSVLKSGAMAGS